MKSDSVTSPEDERTVVTSVRLTEAEHDDLRALAAAEHRSLSQQIRKLVADAVAASRGPS